ncbi:MAG: transferrin receptor-like dimerization domain-containing protein, partial [Planctomycetota bacterium]
ADLQAAIKSHPGKEDAMRIAAVQQVDDCFAKLEDAARAFDAKVMGASSQADVASAQILARRARAIDRALLDESGLPGRPWFRNLLIASDRDSGYKGSALPSFEDAPDGAGATEAAEKLCASAQRLGAVLTEK